MWKKNEEGKLITDENENPIWVDDITQTEKGCDYSSMKKQIAELTEKAHTRKEINDKYISILESAGLSIDTLPDFIIEARSNREKVEGLGKGGRDDKLKPLQEQIDALKKTIERKELENKELIQKQEDEKINTMFLENSYLKEKSDTTLCRDIFKKNFKYIDGVLTGFLNGEKILNDSGLPADFDYCIKAMINTYPSKDKLLVGSLQGGTGASNNMSEASSDLAGLSWFELCKLRDTTTDPVLKETIRKKMAEKK
jgi:hypothetical protein